MTMVACSHHDSATNATEAAGDIDAYARASADMEKAIATDTALTSYTDSLSFYLGLCEGLSFGNQLAGIDNDRRKMLKIPDYRLGVYSAIAADSISLSFARGIKAGRIVSSRLNDLEMKGVKVNRRLIAEVLVEALNNPPADSATILEADSISNIIIQRLK